METQKTRRFGNLIKKKAKGRGVKKGIGGLVVGEKNLLAGPGAAAFNGYENRPIASRTAKQACFLCSMGCVGRMSRTTKGAWEWG
jgi:hypothetical protein